MRVDVDGDVVAGGALEAAKPPKFATGTMQGLPPVRQSTADEEALQIEAASDPALVIDAVHRICAANQHAVILFGSTREELVGSSFDAWIGCDGIQASSLCEVHGVRFIGAARRLFAKHRNGDHIRVELTICALPNGTRMILARPASSQHHDTRREEEMAELVHDLKSPLSTIALEAHLLTQSPPGQRCNMQQVQRIERNIAYMDRLVHELLDLCAVDAGKLEIERRPTELRELVERVLDRVPAFDRERIHVEATGPVAIACDESRIERVIANFVDNALKYSPRRSSVVVRLAIIEGRVRVSVIDQGPGLSAREAAGVFDKYRRGSSSRGHSGSGLGLFVCRKIIEAHDGIVGVESLEGAGSRFYFELPLPRRG